MTHDTWLEQADIYVLGALDGEELAQFESHLAAGCHSCETHLRDVRDAVSLLPQSLDLLLPPAAAKTRLLSQIAEARRASVGLGGLDQPGLLFVRAAEVEWQDVSPGVLVKSLYADPAGARMTALVRMAPGSRYGAHRHAETEELFMLEGDCFCGGRLLHVGDYHRADADSIHEETWTENGCLMLLMTSPWNEMLQ